MFIPIKKAYIACSVSFTLLSTFISKTLFALLKHPMCVLVCKIALFTAIIFLVNTNASPLYEQMFFIQERVVHFYSMFYQTMFLYFSGFTAVYSDLLKLKTLESLLQKRLGEMTDFSNSLSGTLEGVLKNVSELFSSITSMKKDILEIASKIPSLKSDIDFLTRSLASTKADLIIANRRLQKLGDVFIAHQNNTEERLASLNKMLEKVKNPIVGTSTAGLVASSKVVSNRSPR